MLKIKNLQFFRQPNECLLLIEFDIKILNRNNYYNSNNVNRNQFFLNREIKQLLDKPQSERF